MAVFPWSELGLDGPVDERGIRRAYAARLKIVRPDVDAAAFQRLVEARDVALRAVENVALRPSPRPVQPATPPPPKRHELPTPKLTPPPEMRTLAPVTTIDTDAPTNDTADTPPPSDPPRPVEIEISASARPPAEPQQPPSRPRPVTGEPEPPVFETPQAKPDITASDGPEAVSKLLSSFVEAWTVSGRPLPPVAPILKLLGEQSIVARQKLEIEALRAVATVLDKSLFDVTTLAPRQRVARSFLIGLDDDYGWTSNDRRLYIMMQQPAADQMVHLLRAVREWERTGVAPNFAPPPQRKPVNKKAASFGAALLTFAVIKVILMIVSNRPPSFSSQQFTPPPGLSQNYTSTLQAAQASSSFSRGVAFDNQGQLDRAIQEYDQALRLNPSHALAYYNRGLDYASKGQFDRAIADYDQAVRLNPLRPDNFVSRGVAHDARGEYDRAIQDYDQALRLKPAYALALVDRGAAYANKEQYDKAIADYDAALRLNPNDSDALNYRGQAKRAKGDAAGGDADIARADQLASVPPPPKAVIGSPKPSK